jgi:hypothetical protein
MKGTGGQGGRARFKVLTILTLILTLAMLFSPEKIDAKQDTKSGTIVDGNITLRDERIYIQPDGSNITEVKIWGDLFHDIQWSPNTQYVLATFHTDLEGWNFTLPPPRKLKSPSMTGFNLTVQVPFNESGWTYKTFSIRAKWENYPNGNTGNFTSANVTIFISSYHHLEIKYQNDVSMKAGEKERIDLNVYNLGNIDDASDIHILNLSEWEGRGWVFDLSQNKHYYPPGMYETHPLTIEIPFNERSGDHEVHLELISRKGKHIGQNATIYYTINVSVDGDLYFDIGPAKVITISCITMAVMGSMVVVLIFRKRKSTSS